MSRTRVVLGALVTTCLLLGASGCGAGFEAQTQRVYQPADGVVAKVGDIDVEHVLVVVPPAGSAGHAAESPSPTPTPTGTPTPAAEGTTGVLVMTLVNTGTQPDRLVAVAVEQGQVSVNGPTEVPPGGLLKFGAAEDATTVQIHGVTRLAGSAMRLRLTFERAGVIDLQVPLMPALGAYATVTPTVTPAG